jgi:hypothetical protein
MTVAGTSSCAILLREMMVILLSLPHRRPSLIPQPLNSPLTISVRLASFHVSRFPTDQHCRTPPLLQVSVTLPAPLSVSTCYYLILPDFTSS